MPCALRTVNVCDSVNRISNPDNPSLAAASNQTKERVQKEWWID